MAPSSSALLQKRLAAGDAAETGGDDSIRHTQMNATWTSMGAKYHEEAETMGAVRPRSVHEIVARARETVASPMRTPVGQLLQQHKLAQQPRKPLKLQQLAPSKVNELAPTAAAAAAPKPPPAKAAAKAAPAKENDLDDFIKRAESGKLQSVQEKARARAEALVGQRDPRAGTKRKPAGKALGAAAANQQQMLQKVTKRLQERVLTELSRIQNLCPVDPDDVAVGAAKRADEKARTGAARGGANGSDAAPPNDVAFLEAALRQLRGHHQRLTKVMEAQTPAVAPTRSGSRNAAKAPRVAVVQPSQQQKLGGASATPAKPSPAGAGDKDVAAARIQHQYRVRAAVKECSAGYETKLKASRRELHKLRKQQEKLALRQPDAKAAEAAAAAAAAAERSRASSSASTTALAAQLEELRSSLAAETRRADGAEELAAQWERSENDNMSEIAQLREQLWSMERQVASVQATAGGSAVEYDYNGAAQYERTASAAVDIYMHEQPSSDDVPVPDDDAAGVFAAVDGAPPAGNVGVAESPAAEVDDDQEREELLDDLPDDVMAMLEGRSSRADSRGSTGRMTPVSEV